MKYVRKSRRYPLSWLVKSVSSKAIREEMLDDLEEGYRNIEARMGSECADQWYLRQALHSLPDLLIYRIESSSHIRAFIGAVLGAVTAFIVAIFVGAMMESFFGRPTVAYLPTYLIALVATVCAFSSAFSGGCIYKFATGRRNYWVLAAIGAFVLTPDIIFALNRGGWDLAALLFPISAIGAGLSLSDHFSKRIESHTT